MNEVEVVGVGFSVPEFSLDTTIDHKGHTVEVHQVQNDACPHEEYRAEVFIDSVGVCLADLEEMGEDIFKWFELTNTKENLTENDEFLAWIDRIIAARTPATVVAREVPVVDLETVHEAEAAFYERHPGTEAAITDWMKNVNSLIVGSQPFNNVLTWN